MPPDLAIEVELTRSGVDRLGIYAPLGVREVWRHDGSSLTLLVLGADGRYEVVERSAALPDLPPGEVERVVERRASTDDTTLFREFLRRVREGLPGV